jgi:hypothetical protein
MFVDGGSICRRPPHESITRGLPPIVAKSSWPARVRRLWLWCLRHRTRTAIDASAQIRLFRKLKLKKCARPRNRAGFLILCRVGGASSRSPPIRVATNAAFQLRLSRRVTARRARLTRPTLRRMHGCGGGYNHGSLLRACIFRGAGDFLALEGRNLMRFLNGSWVTARARRSSPRARGEGHTARRKTQTRPGEGAFPQAQTRGEAPSSHLLPARGEKE